MEATVRESLVLLVLCLTTLPACGGSTTPPPGGDGSRTEGGVGDGPGRGDFNSTAIEVRHYEPRPPGEFGAGGCDQLGNHLQLGYLARGFDIDSTDVKTESGSQGIIGFSGSSADGYRFWFGREGDPNSGAFTVAKTYFVSMAPYHMMLQRWPAASGASCAQSTTCETYYGLNGIFAVSTVKAPTQGSFNISLIVTQKGCWVDQAGGPPKTTGCTVIGGNFFGCFKVN